jgi:hypothetical protein
MIPFISFLRSTIPSLTMCLSKYHKILGAFSKPKRETTLFALAEPIFLNPKTVRPQSRRVWMTRFCDSLKTAVLNRNVYWGLFFKAKQLIWFDF